MAKSKSDKRELARWDPFEDLGLSDWGAFPGPGLLRRWMEQQPLQRVGMAAPAVDITESGDSYRISAEVPGVRKDDLTLELADGVLTLSGEKKEERSEEQEKGRRLERVYGAFSRSFALPADADPDRVEASFKDGVLDITVAKRPGAKPAQVRIQG